MPLPARPAPAAPAGSTRAGTLRARLISAAIGIPIVFTAVILSWQSTAALAATAAVAVGWESARLTGARGIARWATIGLPLACVTAGIGFASGAQWLLSAALVGAAVLIAGSLGGLGARGVRIAVAGTLVALYFGALLAFAPATRGSESGGPAVLAFALLVSFSVDTSAYFGGRAFGRRKLAPSISPGKTWEGALMGLAAGSAAGAALAILLPLVAGDGRMNFGAATGAGLGLVIAAVAVAGDLLESWFKRKVGAKDASGLIPGHGGVMDRLDSLAPNLAVVYYAAAWLNG